MNLKEYGGKEYLEGGDGKVEMMYIQRTQVSSSQKNLKK